MRHFTYCPIVISHSEALAYALEHAKSGTVLLISKSYDKKLHHREVPFRDTRADTYGYDLYMYQLDASNNETYLSCGGFN